MFVTREQVVDAEFGAARLRLKEIAKAADGVGLAGMSRDAYEQALTRLMRGDTTGTLEDIFLRLTGGAEDRELIGALA